MDVELLSGRYIKMVSAPYFLITKLEAFYGRGGGDFMLSHDMEDIVAVLDGRPSLIDDVIASDHILVEELSTRFQVLLQEPQFIDAVSGHMPTNEASQARVSVILNTIKILTGIQ